MTDEYRTINSVSQGIFKDRGSKFISFAYPVNTEDEIKTILQNLRKDYHDARHHCYAYRLGFDKKLYRANDDGEPSSSAGKPILGQIRSFDLTDVLIVVIRYFGGTLLGVPGLINAYRSAARDAINSNQIVIKTINDDLMINFGYPAMNEVMRIIKEDDLTLKSQEYDMKCKIILSVRRKLTRKVLNKLERIEDADAKIIS